MKTSKAATIAGRCAIAVTVLLLAGGLWLLVSYVKFHNRLMEFKANGSLISLDEIIHEVADPQKDALTFLKQAFPVAKEFTQAIQKDSFGRPKVGTDELSKFEELNSRYPDFFTLISSAAKSPDMSFGLDKTQSTFYSILDVHGILNVLHWKGEVLLSQGDQQGAIRLAIEMLKLSQLVEQPILINAMLSKAFQSMACHLMFESLLLGSIDPALAAEIRRSLDELDLDVTYKNALRGELSLFINHAVGSNSQTETAGSLRKLLAPLSSFGMSAAFGNRYLNQVDLAFERASLPLSNQFLAEEKASWSLLPDPIGDRTKFFNTVRNRFGQNKVERKCVLLLLALSAEADSSNRTEWSLEYLQSIGVSAAQASDPFTDRPLIIRHQEGRWTIYSAGPNQQDDQGKQGSDDVGLGLIPKTR